MIRAWRARLAVLSLVILTLNASTLWAATPGITLIGRGFVDGSALDESGLKGIICQADNPTNCVPKSLLGGFGSAMAFTGYDDVFIAAPDRGPFDGLTSKGAVVASQVSHSGFAQQPLGQKIAIRSVVLVQRVNRHPLT